MDKTTIYEVLKADGAKLNPANFYTPEQLRDLYIERFNSEPENFDEEINTAKLNESDGQAEYNSNSELGLKEIRTVFFDCGFWCKELEKSFAPGYYRPSSFSEYLVLKKYSVREI